MAWSTPYSATTGDLITASIWNTYIKEQQRYLKGLAGGVEIEADLTVPNLITSGNVDGVDVSNHAANTTTVHGAVSAATASKFVVRDGSARAKFGAPNASGDALIKGTRVTATELPAVTDEFYLVGTGGNMEERAAPLDVDYPMKLEFSATRWVIPGWFIHLTKTRVISASQTLAIPIFVEKTTTYIRIGINVTTGASGNADLRIYNFENGLPTSLVLSAGTVDVTSTGSKEITISQELARGYYFLCVRLTIQITVTGADITNAIKPPVAGQASSLSPALREIIYRIDTAYNDPMPTPTTMLNAEYAVVRLREN